MCFDVSVLFSASHLARVDKNLLLEGFPLSIFQVARYCLIQFILYCTTITNCMYYIH